MDSRKATQSLLLCTGAGVRIAVLDSGMNPHFPSLQHRQGKVFDCSEHDGSFLVEEISAQVPSDRSGHGSFVETCIRSVAPGALIDHYRILDENNNCNGKLLCYVLDHVLQKGYNLVNLSLGTRNEDHVPWLVSIMKRAYEGETSIVAACSNVGSSVYPAQFTYAISCDAMLAQHPLQVKFNRKSIIEFSGWGVNVPVLGLNQRTHHLTGSSFAAAHITGLAARIIEMLGTPAPLDVKIQLRNYAITLEQEGKNAHRAS